MFNLIFALCCVSYVFFCFYKGCKRLRYIESVCTTQVNAKIDILKTKHFFTAKYYIANFSYEYEGKKYTVRKGLFKTVGEDNMNIYINPENPEECEILRIRERIKCK